MANAALATFEFFNNDVEYNNTFLGQRDIFCTSYFDQVLNETEETVLFLTFVKIRGWDSRTFNLYRFNKV